jgi:hypothetical protein
MVTATPTEKRRGIIVDLLIGIGIPILQMVARTYASEHLPRPFV